MEEGIVVMSCFDGMSCGQLALRKAGIKVKTYYASEIEKGPIAITQLNFPDTQQLGSVTDVRAADREKVDLLIGGSPCQGFSFAGKGLNFDDPRSKLFFEFVRLLNECRAINPAVKFLLENVKMKAEHEQVITRILEVEPIKINSALVSAQNRQRLYWTNINQKKKGLFDEKYCGIPQPNDKGIMLADILETDYPFELFNKKGKKKKDQTKAGCLTGTAHAAGNHSEMDVIVKHGEKIIFSAGKRINIHTNPFIRRYSVIECCRLQTVPDNYFQNCSNSTAYKALINGWNVDTIVHILNYFKP